ncbi:GGDEF domain-containing protein [Cupriavidus basilensis]|uniref:diguanylate cyclase n=1 Tax=Cupriavidus basilensis TaxID=68895 RepID=A0ABT6B4L8_9BURK|nr:GGDEF domain-containing protein [Cupriavidus basilensis]MDF3839826.1 GGDEF domain-containing protein [Cupriavidus basilensis]
MSGSLILVVTPVLFWLRGIAPDWLSIVVANGLMIVAMGLWMLATQAFYGRPQTPRLVAGAAVATTVLVAWFAFVEPSYGARLLIVTFVVACFYATLSVLILRQGDRHFSTYFFGGLMIVQTLVVLMRFATGLVGGLPNPTLFASDDVVQTIYLASYTFMDLALSVAFMLVVTRRVHLELETLSRTDPLTQLLNRRALYDAGKVELARMHDHGDEMTLLLIDLDHFKRINDSLGHAEGDRVLTDFSAMLKRELPANAYPGRFGGEEFLVLLPHTGMGAALGLAERLRATSSRYFGRRVADLTISIGVACVDEADTRLVATIGRALYRAKSSGRNRVEVMIKAAGA